MDCMKGVLGDMAGHGYTVSGDPAVARETVYSVLQSQGFSVTRKDEWNAHAERGSKGASIALGALAGKSGRHVVLDISCHTDPQGFLVISLRQGTSGWSGGIIGVTQADAVYSEIYNTVGSAFQNAGVLVSGGSI